MMVPEMEKARVTEIKVRMDCNGCVQKIKKALHGIAGIHNIYVDLPQQKITIIGWAEPEKIVKAIRKTRKSAIICLHTEQQPDQPPTPEGEAPPPDPTTPPSEPTQPDPTEPSKEQPQPENPPPEPNPSNENANASPRPEMAKATPSQPKDQEEIHVVHHHPPDYSYRFSNFQQGYNGQWNSYRGGQQLRDGPSHPPHSSQPVYMTHSYNTYQPSPYVTEFVYAPSPPRYSRYNAHDNNTRNMASDYNMRYSAPDYNVHYSAPDYNVRYSEPDNNVRYYAPDYNVRYSPPEYNMHNSIPDYYNRDYYGGNNGTGNITSMFSEENPNACRIA